MSRATTFIAILAIAHVLSIYYLWWTIIGVVRLRNELRRSR